MLFDARAAKQLHPGAHLAVQGCPGLRLVATASTKSWVYRYKSRADGKLKQVTLGHWPAMPAATAAAAWQAQREGRAQGLDPVAQRKAQRAAERVTPAPKVFTVTALVTAYVKGHIKTARAEAGAVAATRALNCLLNEEPAFAATPADQLTRAEAFRVLSERRGTPTAAARLRSLLGAAWDYALDAGLLDGNTPNWWRMVLRGGLKSKGKLVGGQHLGRQRRVLSREEVAKLLGWLPNMHALGQDAVVMYLWTATRGVEFLAMRPEQLRREADGLWWQVPKASTKNARHTDAVDLRVPLFGRALAVVERRLAAVGESGWLFEDVRGAQYTQHDFSTYIFHMQPYSPRVMNRTGEGLVLPVTHWSPHDLRRTARTLLASLGCPNEVGEAIVGHMPTEIVGTYNAYTYDAERKLWLAKLSDCLAALANAESFGLGCAWGVKP